MRCSNCNKELENKKPHTGGHWHYCSAYCRGVGFRKTHREWLSEYNKKRRLRTPLPCMRCGKTIPAVRRGSGVTLCSEECVTLNDKDAQRSFRFRRRMSIFDKLGGRKCIYCGCNDVVVLEINHRNGGGCRELRAAAGSNFIQRIFYGKRKIDDLEVVCRVCNAWHYAKTKNPKGSWVITWRQQ